MATALMPLTLIRRCDIVGTLPLSPMSMHVLVVCTANVCRSPMAEGLLHHHLLARGLDVTVTSAGTHSVSLSVDPEAVHAARRLGVDISAHSPRQFTPTILADEGADLIVTMTREHLRAVATTCRGSLARTFTLRELVRRASALQSPGESWADWLAALGQGRRVSELLKDEPADEVSDPYGLGASRVRAVADELDQLTSALVALGPWMPNATLPG